MNATIYVCEDFAKKLYGAEIDTHSDYYDNCEMHLYDDPSNYDYSGGQGIELDIEVAPMILPFRPSF